ncbi:hypothetical protein Tco_0639168 [Tanacetum coccineum]
MLLGFILHGLFQYKVVEFPANKAMGIAAVTRMQTFTDLTSKENIIKESDIKVANIILHELSNDIYTLLNLKKIAYEIWYRVKELMGGTELTKQEKESKLVDEFEKFTSKKGETIHSYYIKKVDAYDSKVNEVPTANAIFMAKLSPAGSINKDGVGPLYDLDT